VTALTLGGPSPPDDPLRRLVWVLPLAVLLVLLGLVAAARWLHQPQLPTPQRQPPVDARIYELPTKRASSASKPQPAGPTHPHAAAPANAKPSRPASAKLAPKQPEHARHAAPPVPKAATALPKPHPAVTQPRASTPPASASSKASPQSKTLDWGKLTSQINSVASSVVSHSQFAQVHDPHTLVARYYLEALLEKLQRIGDMVYDGQNAGTVVVRLIVGADGSLQALELNGLNGAGGLEPVAHHIVNLAAPFAPFPSNLAKQTRRLKLSIHMKFLGMHSVNAW
jgi:periplasmic protein TonB